MVVPVVVAGAAACCIALQDCGADENGVDPPPTGSAAPLEETGAKATKGTGTEPLGRLPSGSNGDIPLAPLPVSSSPSHIGRRSSTLPSSGGKSEFHNPQQQGIDQREGPISRRKRIRAKLERITSYNAAEMSRVHGEAEESRETELPPQGYVNGTFTDGRVRDIVPPSDCFVIKFNVDASLLAVGMKRGEGVAIYETKYFSIVHIIEQQDTVSAIDWAPLTATEGQARSNTDGCASLLAVGSFDGAVVVYLVNSELIELEGIAVLQRVRLKSEIRALRFMIGRGMISSERAITLAIGEKNGHLSFLSFVANGRDPQDPSHLQSVHDLESGILSIQFCPEIKLMATGTKDGRIIVNMLHESCGTVSVGNRLCEIQRNGAVHCLSFSSDSSRLFAGGYDKSLVVIDAQVWDIVREIKVEGTIQSMEYDPLGRYLAVGSRVRTLILYDTSTLHPVKEFSYGAWVASLSWGSGIHENRIAVRCGSKLITLVDLRPTHIIATTMETGRTEGSSLSWSYDGQFLARANGNEVVIAGASSSFSDVAMAEFSSTVRCLRFCHCPGKRDKIAVVGLDGFITVYRLKSDFGQLSLEVIQSTFVEKHLWQVAWSSDGTFLACGGRGKKLHLLSATHLEKRCEPIQCKGRVWAIDFMPNGCCEIGLAVGTGDYLATIFDISSELPNPTLQVARPRTVRCLCYHPDLPVLALGDGANNVAIIDLIEEESIWEFSVAGRVHSLDFSRCGAFLAVASDDCRFTIHETGAFKVVQEIPTSGLATAVKFSGVNSNHLALDSEIDDAKVVHLGPFLSTQFIPLTGGVGDLPDWRVNEALYRSGEGPSLLQRYMREGSGDSVKQAAAIMEKYPDTTLTFDRTNDEDCYDTALAMRRPNLLKALLLQVVKGGSESDIDRCHLTHKITQIGVDILLDMLAHHPPDFVVEILHNMSFIKVPFTNPRVCSPYDEEQCGSSSFTDPWGAAPADPRESMKRSDKAYVFNEVEERIEFVRTPAVLPLQGLGSVRFLSALIKSAPPDAFDNDAMGIVLRVMWYKHVRWYFLVDLALFVIFYILWVLYINWSATTTYHNSPLLLHEWAAIFFVVLILAFNTLFAVKEVVESNWGRNRKHLFSWWNMVDLISTVLVYIYTVSTAIVGIGSGSVPLGVVTTFFMTLKLLAYLRGFGETGWLISVLTANFNDIRGFICVLFIILLGFTAVFRLLFGDVPGACTLALDPNEEVVEDCDRDPFGTLSVSMLSTFELAVVGAYDSALFDASSHSVLAGLAFVVAVTVVLVVALNALIAVLGDSYSRIQKHERANRRKERAELIIEYIALMSTTTREQIEHETKYFHALLEADADGDLVVNKDDWQGGLNALKSDLTQVNEENAMATLKAIDQLKLDIENEMNEMKREMGNVLEEVRSEMKVLVQMQREGAITLGNTNVARAVKSVTTIGKNIPKLAQARPFAGPGQGHQFAGRNLLQPFNQGRGSTAEQADREENQTKQSSRPGSPTSQA